MPSILDRLRRRTTPAPAEPRDQRVRARRVARRLSRAIDAELARGRMARADELARRGMRLCPSNSRLAECVARLRLAQGRPELALRVLEGCARRIDSLVSLRLLYNACLIQAGRSRDAQLDLLRWADGDAAPVEARLLLGLLEYRRGDATAALRAWRATLQRDISDPATLAALTAMCAHRDRPRQVQMWAQRLRATGGEEADLILRSLGQPGCTDADVPAANRRATLALELIAAEAAIGPLVEAQRLQPHGPTVRLLRDAIAEALDELRDRAAACEALAELSLILDERDDAACWAAAGFQANPMSATLAIMVTELTRTSPPAPLEKAA